MMKSENYSLTRMETGSMRSFNAKFKKTVTEILIQCEISTVQEPGEFNNERKMILPCLIDTGANHSWLTIKTALALSLITDKDLKDGSWQKRKAVIRITLPNLIIFPLEVGIASDIPRAGVIIGMDILNHADYYIGNSEKVTSFTCEMPSVQRSQDIKLCSQGKYKVVVDSSVRQRPFKVIFDSIMDRIIFQVSVTSYKGSVFISEKNFIQVNAILDTGTINSGITKKLAEKLKLKILGQQKAFTHGGPCLLNIYMINIKLPNSLIIPVPVLETKDNDEYDLLLGMDILSQGETRIENLKGFTVFSFELLPSKMDDLVNPFSES